MTLYVWRPAIGRLTDIVNVLAAAVPDRIKADPAASEALTQLQDGLVQS